MKNRFIVILVSVFLLAGFDAMSQCPGSKAPCKNTKCASNKSKAVSAKQSKVEKSDVIVYYFHNSRRCATCNAVEEVTQATLKELYPEKFKDGKITFLSINIEEDGHEKLVKELEITGQTLLVVSGEKKVNLTNDAFMYVKTKPEKLKKKIQKTIDEIV